MIQRQLQITLLDDVVFSASSATTGGHRSLDYVPGSALLGWAASKLYSKVAQEQAFWIFHSGSLRFGNGLPVTASGAIGYPMPFCWHHPKGVTYSLGDTRLDGTKISNAQFGLHMNGRQPVQMTEGYVGTDGTFSQPLRQYRMKTSIELVKARAEVGGLFGYEALRAGQRFVAQLKADENRPDAKELVDRVCEVFDQDIARFGRSRRSEYGKAFVSVDGGAPSLLIETEKVENKLTIWTTSDLALLDTYGTPCFQPSAQEISPDLPPGRLIPEKSFMRTRVYSPYNGYLRRHMEERSVISQGSILCFDLDNPPSQEVLSALDKGLGAYQEAGLGQVLLNPILLSAPTPKFVKEVGVLEFYKPPLPLEPSLNTYAEQLVSWADARISDALANQNLEAAVEIWCEQLKRLYQTGRRQNAISPGAEFGPGSSQWGLVYQKSREDRIERDHLMKALFDGEKAVCGEDIAEPKSSQNLRGDRNKSDLTWQAESALGNRITTFRSWLRTSLEGFDSSAENRHFARAVGQLANQGRQISKMGTAELVGDES